MTPETEQVVELLRQRSRGYRAMAATMDTAGGIASGQGSHKLANDCWALASRLKDRQTELNRKICELQNPDYPAKKVRPVA